MGAKNIAAIVVLIAVIVGALYFVAKKVGGGTKPPPKVFQTPVELMDTDSSELITKTAQEWEDLGKKDGAYKNPNTSKYTMVHFRACAACQVNIPVETPPADAHKTPGGFERWEATLKCPKCGKSPFPLPGAPIRRPELGARGKTPAGPGKAPAGPGKAPVSGKLPPPRK